MKIDKNTVSIAQIYYRTFWFYYDHLGTLILINFIAFLSCLTVFAWSVGFTLLLIAVDLTSQNSSLDVHSFFRLARQHLAWSLGYGLFVLFINLLLFANIYFYLQLSQFSIFFTLLTGLFVWFLFFVFLITLWIFPLKIFYGKSFQQNLKIVLFLIFDNLASSLLVGLSCLLILIVGIATAIGIVFLGLGIIAVLITITLQMQLRRYDLISGRDEEEKRSWHDLIRPWEF